MDWMVWVLVCLHVMLDEAGRSIYHRGETLLSFFLSRIAII